MKLRKAIRTIIEDKHISFKELSSTLGYKTASGLTNLLYRDNITAANMKKICDALGYEIVLRPKTGTDRAKRSIVVDEI